MMKNTTQCEWENVPALSQVASAFVPLCVDMIQLNYKTCTDILPWYRKITFVDFLVIALATGILTALKPLVVEVTQEILARYCNNADRNLMRASDMMYECATRVLIVSWTFYDILLAPKCSYLKAPTHVLRGIWEAGASGADMSPERRLLLLFTISRYSSALIDVLFVAEKRKDSISLMIHHVVAVFMMTAAYTTFPEVGLSVFFLHEACDPSLELAKILHYLQRRGETNTLLSKSSEVCFIVFIIKWFILRIYLFPVRGLYPPTAVDKNSCVYGSYAAIALLSSFLFTLNVVWSFMIIKAVVNRFVYSHLTDETMDSPQEQDQQSTKKKQKVKNK